MSYEAKQSQVRDRQLKVQRLVIPFTVVGHATAASVSLSCDEPALMFFQSEGVNQITDALDTDETATYTDTAPGDSAGELNVLIKVGEDIEKVLGCQLYNRDADGFGGPDATDVKANLGSATGITTGDGGGKSIMLSIDTGETHATGTHLKCIVVEYVVSE